MPKTRVEVVTPGLPDDAITDETFRRIQAPARIKITPRELARQCGIPHHLIRWFTASRHLHPATSGEAAAGLGMCAEELTALILAGHVIERWKAPPRSALQTFAVLVGELLTAISPARVCLCVLESNKRIETRVSTGTGKIVVPPEIDRFMEILDATRLMAAVEEALGTEPLRLPGAGRCAVGS